VDPIHPIAPGPPPTARAGRVPVQRVERITRERDRPPTEERERRKQDPPQPPPQDGEDEDGHRHIDVRV
jgi:hypothetical protein